MFNILKPLAAGLLIISCSAFADDGQLKAEFEKNFEETGVRQKREKCTAATEKQYTHLTKIVSSNFISAVGKKLVMKTDRLPVMSDLYTNFENNHYYYKFEDGLLCELRFEQTFSGQMHVIVLANSQCVRDGQVVLSPRIDPVSVQAIFCD